MGPPAPSYGDAVGWATAPAPAYASDDEEPLSMVGMLVPPPPYVEAVAMSSLAADAPPPYEDVDQYDAQAPLGAHPAVDSLQFRAAPAPSNSGAQHTTDGWARFGGEDGDGSADGGGSTSFSTLAPAISTASSLPPLRARPELLFENILQQPPPQQAPVSGRGGGAVLQVGLAHPCVHGPHVQNGRTCVEGMAPAASCPRPALPEG